MGFLNHCEEELEFFRDVKAAIKGEAKFSHTKPRTKAIYIYIYGLLATRGSGSRTEKGKITTDLGKVIKRSKRLNLALKEMTIQQNDALSLCRDIRVYDVSICVYIYCTIFMDVLPCDNL